MDYINLFIDLEMLCDNDNDELITDYLFGHVLTHLTFKRSNLEFYKLKLRFK